MMHLIGPAGNKSPFAASILRFFSVSKASDAIRRWVFEGLVGILAICLSASCTSHKSTVTIGLGQGKAGYVPARIAVLACRMWPKSANFSGIRESNADLSARSKLCQSFDEQVLTAFRDQPYMKGFTPAAVNKLLAASSPSSDVLSQFEQQWDHLSSDCEACTNFASYYDESIRPRSLWRQWLNAMSAGTRNSDAMLIPFVLEMVAVQHNDRGMLTSTISASLGLLLVDTNNGDILWTGERTSQFAATALSDNADSTYPPYPPWEQLADRLFTEALWKDFPGRLIL